MSDSNTAAVAAPVPAKPRVSAQTMELAVAVDHALKSAPTFVIDATDLAMVGVAERMLAEAQAFVLPPGDAALYTLANERFKNAGVAERQLKERRLTKTRPVDAMKEAIMSFYRGPGTGVQEAKAIYEKAISAEDRRLEQERRAEEDRLRAIQVAEERRVRAAAAALEAEAAAKRRVAEQAAAKLESENNAAAAQALRDEADQAAAALDGEASMMSAAAETMLEPIAAPPPPPRAAGVSSRKNWSAVIESEEKLMNLLEGIVAGKAPIAAVFGLKFVEGDEYPVSSPFLNQQARAMKKALPYPGVTPVSTSKLAG